MSQEPLSPTYVADRWIRKKMSYPKSRKWYCDLQKKQKIHIMQRSKIERAKHTHTHTPHTHTHTEREPDTIFRTKPDGLCPTAALEALSGAFSSRCTCPATHLEPGPGGSLMVMGYPWNDRLLQRYPSPERRNHKWKNSWRKNERKKLGVTGLLD